MTIMIELNPELERELQMEAAKLGLEPQHFVLDMLEERLRSISAPVPHLSQVETELLAQINLGFPAEWWEQYERLKIKRSAEELTADDQVNLIEMSDQIEEANVRRMRALIELARLRTVSVEGLMQQLGLHGTTDG